MYNYEKPYQSYWITLIKKIFICFCCVSVIFAFKKLDNTFTNVALSKIDYYISDWEYDLKSLGEKLDKIPNFSKNVPVFKQIKSSKFISPVNGTITSDYGMRLHPILKVNRMHNGIDISQKEGNPVRAVSDGIVIFVGEEDDLGLKIIIEHKNNINTVYGHLKDVYVKKNDHVKQGSIIGTVGNSGLSESPHLHFEIIKDGKPQDPKKWIQQE